MKADKEQKEHPDWRQSQAASPFFVSEGVRVLAHKGRNFLVKR
jgi:hypothetical protein